MEGSENFFFNSKCLRCVIKLGHEANEKKSRATRRDPEKDAANHARSIHCAAEESCQDAGEGLFQKTFSLDLRVILITGGGS